MYGCYDEEVRPSRVGLWRSWERASMAWKRSRVRIPSGPPKKFTRFSDRVGIQMNFLHLGDQRLAGKWPIIYPMGQAMQSLSETALEGTPREDAVALSTPGEQRKFYEKKI